MTARDSLQPRHGSVGVIIPSYNSARFLPFALASVFDQTYANFQVVVVDDGSTDDTRALVHNFTDARLQYVYQDNQGVPAARNRGIRLLQTDYLAFLDADDEWEPRFLERCVTRAARDGRNFGGVYTSYAYIDSLGRVLPQAGARVVSPRALHTHLIQENILLIHSVVIRTEVIQQVGPFDTQLGTHEDWDLWLRVTRRYLLRGIAEPLARYRVRTDSRSFDPQVMHANRMRALAKHFGLCDRNACAWPEQKRTAYAYGYRASAFDYFRAQRAEEGRELLRRAVELAPELLERSDTYYELAAKDQPRGWRGDTAALDVRATATEVLTCLESVLSQSAETARRRRPAARAQAFLVLGMLAQRACMWTSARKFLLRALAARPRLLLNPSVVKRMLRVCTCEAGAWVRPRARHAATLVISHWLILALVVAVAFQMPQLAPAEKATLQQLYTRPGDMVRPYPELRGGATWVGRRSDSDVGADWEMLLDQAGQLVPEREPVLFVWPTVLSSDASASYGHSQAVYALFPRPVVLVFARPEPYSDRASPDYVIAYGPPGQRLDLPGDAAKILFCAKSACLYQLRTDSHR